MVPGGVNVMRQDRLRRSPRHVLPQRVGQRFGNHKRDVQEEGVRQRLLAKFDELQRRRHRREP